jgi:glycosyltransferase involved in cell wall biosynthesis
MTTPHNPKISIIMPTYNGTKYLRQAIDSIISQTFQDYELIIVDDCSTDNTREVVSSYQDPRIRYLRNEKNLRLPNTLNVGFRASRGQYLTWTSDDNYHAPEAIGVMYSYLNDNNADFVYCDMYNVYVADNNAIKERKLEGPERNKIENCVGACFMYSRKVYEAIGDYNADAELVEDYEYWIRVMQKFQLHHIARPLYYYRYHELSLWGTKYTQIQIMEYLLKLKFDLLNASETNWALRGLKLKARQDVSTWHKIINRLVYKSKVQKVLDAFKKNSLSYKDARAELSLFIYGRTDDAKHFVFLRKFAPDWEWGGTETILMDWFDKINFGKCKVTLVVPEGSKKIFEQKVSSRPWRLNIVEMPFSLNTGAMQRFKLMNNFLKTLRPDAVIFVHGWYADFRAAEFLAAFCVSRGQTFLHENGSPPELQSGSGQKGLGLWKIWQRLYVAGKSLFCQKVYVISQGVKDRLVAYWWFDQKKVQVIPHGIDLKRFYPSFEIHREMRQKWNLDQTAKIIFISARLAREKRLDRAIDAFALVAQEFPDAILIMAGQGLLEAELKAQAQRLNLSGRIIFTGRIDQIADVYRMSDVFICCSEMESFGISLLEAMASELICLSTRCFGPNDIIEDGISGFFINDDPRSIADFLRKVFKMNEPARQAMTQSARQRVVSLFDEQRNTRHLLGTLQIPYKAQA